jgi:hypothetical protein
MKALEDTDLTKADLADTTLDGAHWDDRTQQPAGFQPPENTVKV